MAITKTIETDNGVITTYHRIESIYMNKDKQVKLDVKSYASQKYREKEIDDAHNSSLYAIPPEYALKADIYIIDHPIDEISYRIAYNELKNIEPFIGAEDA